MKTNFVVIRLRKVLPWLALIIAVPVIFSCFNRTKEVYNVNGREIPIYSVERNDNSISITFDCAWGNEDIDSILDTLDKYNCRATFFVLGEWAKKYSDSIVKIQQRGHEIGNHSYNHKDYTQMSYEDIVADVKKSDLAIESITGICPKLVRAPSGGYNDTVVKACEADGKTYIQWSLDSIDYKAQSADEIIQRITSQVKAGDIILLHNGTEHTAAALPYILENLSERFNFMKVSDLIYYNNYEIDHTGRQFIAK